MSDSTFATKQIELLNFEGEILTNDRGILRRIKVKGDGFSNPNEGANVHVHLKGTCRDRLFDCRDVNFVVGEAEDKDVPFGVDRAMDKMQKGECCLLYLKPKYAFGCKGKPEFEIGPEDDVVYEVTLKDFQRAKEYWEMDLKEKLELAAKVKCKGNQYFKAGWHFQAVIQYQRIISWLEMECGAGLEEQKRIQDFLLTSHLNLALCYLRMKEFSHAVENCNKVIELDEHNEKALYRRGEARLHRNEFSLAMTDFQQVLHRNPSNRAARAQITACQDKIKEHHEQDKRTYANMFQKFADRDAKTGKRKKRKSVNGEICFKRQRRSQECSL
ncbi:unnamed protein product [Tetraodon nigroviridis]|uniref:peptidylprolyl isomerase n=1 Tax=Tetraodon nigroviridis TaxID=99883 RepID=Q4RXE4_TETNG|nr:unnamed protein product [Tetraodon nigroviridis]